MAASLLAASSLSAGAAPDSSYGPNVFPDVPQVPEDVSISVSKRAKTRLLEAAAHSLKKELDIWENDWLKKGKQFGYCFYSPMSGAVGTTVWLPDAQKGKSVVFSRDCGTADRSQVAISCGKKYNLMSSNYGGDGWSPWQIPGINRRDGQSDAELAADVCFYAR